MKSEPVKLSVITVTLNAVQGFRTTARSIAEQDFPSREWIVIDGGSTDGTVAIIRDFEQHINYWSSEPDKGIYDAMNKGLSKARGEWVIFMNAGDYFPGPGILTRVLAHADNSEEILYGDTLIPYGNFTRLRYAGRPDELVKGMAICHQALYARRSIIPEGGFDTAWPICADVDMLLKWWKEGRRFHYVGFPCAVFDNGGVTSRIMFDSAYEVYQIVKKVHGLTFSLWIYHMVYLGWIALLYTVYRIFPARFIFSVRDFLVRLMVKTVKQHENTDVKYL